MAAAMVLRTRAREGDSGGLRWRGRGRINHGLYQWLLILGAGRVRCQGPFHSHSTPTACSLPEFTIGPAKEGTLTEYSERDLVLPALALLNRYEAGLTKPDGPDGQIME